MATLDVASKGTPSLVYPISIITAFLQRGNILTNVKSNIDGGNTVGASVAVRLTLSNGTSFDDRSLLQYLAKLAADAVSSPPISIVRPPTSMTTRQQLN